ncbi:MAG: PhoU domain-containing protein, partial [Bacteroidota bacterium]
MQRHFEAELDRLRTTLIRMASLVDEQIETGIRAVLQCDSELADRVIQRDKEVDGFDNEIDKLCIGILALSQPVAIDLRLLLSALKIN